MALAPKQHLEFIGVDMKNGWEVPPGYPPGFTQKVLASDLDEIVVHVSRETCRIERAFSLRRRGDQAGGQR